MTPAQYHEFQLLRMALAFDKLKLPGMAAATEVLRDAAGFIREQAAGGDGQAVEPAEGGE